MMRIQQEMTKGLGYQQPQQQQQQLNWPNNNAQFAGQFQQQHNYNIGNNGWH